MKYLLVYYSYTGNTKTIVDKISKKIDCDVLELEPEIAYPTNYDEVVKKYQNNENQKTKTKLKPYNVNLDKYDKIIIGTPVWWYTITPVIRTFLSENDLSKKIVIPFATNAGWLGKTFQEIKGLCPKSKIEQEISIVFTEDYNDHKVKNGEEVDKWIEKLMKEV